MTECNRTRLYVAHHFPKGERLCIMDLRRSRKKLKPKGKSHCSRIWRHVRQKNHLLRSCANPLTNLQNSDDIDINGDTRESVGRLSEDLCKKSLTKLRESQNRSVNQKIKRGVDKTSSTPVGNDVKAQDVITAIKITMQNRKQRDSTCQNDESLGRCPGEGQRKHDAQAEGQWQRKKQKQSERPSSHETRHEKRIARKKHVEATHKEKSRGKSRPWTTR